MVSQFSVIHVRWKGNRRVPDHFTIAHVMVFTKSLKCLSGPPCFLWPRFPLTYIIIFNPLVRVKLKQKRVRVAEEKEIAVNPVLKEAKDSDDMGAQSVETETLCFR
ncbi:Uncharacterized protein APZ42_002905 [Daphnia magna]|uniref:Uncharacterized protein n=1 Tax=Daphnia magna TaxID=35525 RepID=A0A164HYQ0_9CRUS|nr:Uncharacterized protein APZ42_002905 [Daphnia magna]